AEDGIRDATVTGVQTCALPICANVVMEARGFAERLARGPSFALGITKDALNREAHMDLVTALEAEAQAQAGCMRSPNFREAYERSEERRVGKECRDGGARGAGV